MTNEEFNQLYETVSRGVSYITGAIPTIDTLGQSYETLTEGMGELYDQLTTLDRTFVNALSDTDEMIDDMKLLRKTLVEVESTLITAIGTMEMGEEV